MDLKSLQAEWEKLGENDPLRAILVRSDEPEDWRWNPHEFFETGRRDIERVFARLAARGLAVDRRAALDFGCGVGRLTQPLAERFDLVYGVDIASSMIEGANRYNSHDNCRYVHNAADNLEIFVDGNFDFICSFIVLQHMEPVYSLKYIAEFLRVLRSRGILVFQLPSGLKETERKAPSTARRTASRIAPLWAKKLYRRGRRSLARKPVIEMHCVNREEIIDHLEVNGGFILDILQDDAAPSYVSLSYYVTKKP